MQLIKILHSFMINIVFYKPQKKNSRNQIWRMRWVKESVPPFNLMIREFSVQKGTKTITEVKFYSYMMQHFSSPVMLMPFWTQCFLIIG